MSNSIGSNWLPSPAVPSQVTTSASPSSAARDSRTNVKSSPSGLVSARIRQLTSLANKQPSLEHLRDDDSPTCAVQSPSKAIACAKSPDQTIMRLEKSYSAGAMVEDEGGIDSPCPKVALPFPTTREPMMPNVKVGRAVRENAFFIADQTTGLNSDPCWQKGSRLRQLSRCIPSRLAEKGQEELLVKYAAPRPSDALRHPQDSPCRAVHLSHPGEANGGPKLRLEAEELDINDQGRNLRALRRLGYDTDELRSSQYAFQRLADISTGLDGNTGPSQEDSSDAQARDSICPVTRRKGPHSINRDGMVLSTSMAKSHDLDQDVVTPLTLHTRYNASFADDVFGPIRRLARAAPWRQKQPEETEPLAEGTRTCGTSALIQSSNLDTALGEEPAIRRSAESLRDGGEITTRSSSDRESESSASSSTGEDQPRSRGGCSGRETSRTKTPSQGRSWSATRASPAPSAMAESQSHSQGTSFCLPSAISDEKPEPWPQLRRLERRSTEKRASRAVEPLLWSRGSLRKVSSFPGGRRLGGDISWTLPLRPSPKKKERQERMSPPRRPKASPRVSPARASNTCSFCNPVILPKTPLAQGPSCRDAAQSRSAAVQSHAQVDAMSRTFRARPVEQSLAPTRLDGLKTSERGRKASHASLQGSRTWTSGEALAATSSESCGDCSSPECHGCSWRDRYMSLRAEMEAWTAELKACDGDEGASARESRVRRAEQAAAASSDDAGIQGVTVVLHMRRRDDVVIKTKLRSASLSYSTDSSLRGRRP